MFYLVQFPLCLFLHPSDVIHGQVHPAVQPAEQLPVKISKEPLFLLLEDKEQGRAKSG